MNEAAASLELAIQDPDDGRYPGGKSQAGLHQWICARLPDHVFYCEPFAGHGGIFRNKVPALRTLLIDQDPDVVDWWDRRLERSVGRGQRGYHVVDHRRPRRARPSHTEVLHCCGIQWIEMAARWITPDWLVYCDPPYLPASRVKQKLYHCEMTLADHKRFLRAVRKLPCPVAVSGYPSTLYFEYLADWKCETREVITRGHVLRTECLWTNASAAEASAVSMHYSELGPDFRTRERVARKVKRWGSKFQELPAAERRAILLGMMNIERSLDHVRR